MHLLVQQIERIIAREHLFADKSRLLLGVSGGVDSMVLLHVLKELAPRHGWRLGLAHFNHRLRGRSSGADQRFVAAEAKRLGLPCRIGSGDVAAAAARLGISIEMAGRLLRRRFLKSCAVRMRSQTIVLAHHADDQVELFFLRLLRGSGTDGLSGMRTLRQFEVGSALKIARPLLNCDKKALLEYATEHNIRFREDASNVSSAYKRNRIRHQLLPMLQTEYQPCLNPIILRTMGVLAAESACLDELAQAWLEKTSPEPFEGLPLAIRRRVIQIQLHALGVIPDFQVIDQLIGSPGRPVHVDHRQIQGWSGPDKLDRAAGRPCLLTRDPTGKVHLEAASPPPSASGITESTEIQLGSRGSVTFGDMRIEWRSLGKRAVPRSMLGRELFDAEKVGSCVTLRRWQAGDRFQPIGMTRPVKLQDLFVNAKIPRQRRRELVLGVAASGEVFWVQDLRISEGYKIVDSTRKVLEWRWQEA